MSNQVQKQGQKEEVQLGIENVNFDNPNSGTSKKGYRNRKR